MVGGASLGGVLVAAVGPGWGLATDAVSFVVAAACFAAIRVVPGDRLPSSNVIAELREGWTAFRSRTWLWVVVLAFGVINAVHAAGWYTLGPLIADKTFGRQGWGFVLAAETDGMFLAGVLLLRIGQVLAGPLAAAVGVREAVVLCAVAVMVAGGLATAVPAVRRLERTDLSLAGPVRG